MILLKYDKSRNYYMTITSQQFNKLSTKKDLEKLVTKRDLKKDLEKLATKDELKKIEQKMDKKFDAAFDMFASKEDLKKLVSRDEIADVKNEILTAIDGIARRNQDFESELAANQGAHDRFEEEHIKINKIDKRVGIIEKKLEIVPVAA